MQNLHFPARCYWPAPRFGQPGRNCVYRFLISLVLLFLIPEENFGQKNRFLRLYGQDGKKMAAGRLLSVSDSGMVLRTNKGIREFVANDIYSIRHRRTVGHTALVTGLAAGTLGAIIGAASADPDAIFFGYSAGEGAAVGFGAGLMGGAALGGLIGLAKKRTIHYVHNSVVEWQKLKVFYDDWLREKNE